MLTGKVNENIKKTTTIGLISKKATLHVQFACFVHFFAVVLHDCNVKLPETSQFTRFMEEMLDVFLFTFFSLSLIFTLVAASIQPLQNFILFLQQKISPFVFFSLTLAPFNVELLWPVAYFLFFSVCLFLYIRNLWT